MSTEDDLRHGDHEYGQTLAVTYDGTGKIADEWKFCDESDDRGGHCICPCHFRAH
ncbi:hypothetical protein [Streptomyces sp. TLI_146]|uniref:hypothetical protein n=1 Tax=Streptomyces sp. TLI_146 TaxID=1938858 RepID=UPI000CB3DA16|nr:hypothetical protein [Streptomyces sp. TLI_146]PKV82795.1 hypothetical protein BX283_0254 [Streptomyces sp. TLI_146]